MDSNSVDKTKQAQGDAVKNIIENKMCGRYSISNIESKECTKSLPMKIPERLRVCLVVVVVRRGLGNIHILFCLPNLIFIF